MTVITEHHSEEEGESNHGERSGVSFAVGGDTIHVGDFLEGGNHFVRLEVGRRVQDSAVDFIVIIAVGLEGGGLELLEFAMDFTLVFTRSPEEADEGVATLFHLVETTENCLFLDNEPSSHFKVADAVGVRRLLGVVQTSKVVLDSFSGVE